MKQESISCFRHFVSIVPLRLINGEQSEQQQKIMERADLNMTSRAFRVTLFVKSPQV